MKVKKLIHSCLLSVVALGVIVLTNRCANPVMPQGGPKDTEPPKLVKATPPNLSMHFNAKQIALEFDEFLVLKEIGKKFLMSPPPLERPEFKVKRRTLEITLKDSLYRNTTYSLYFADAITDLNENNPLPDFQYVFSTGASIDSLEMAGVLRDAFTLKPVENAMVMLWYKGNDSIPLWQAPMHLPPAYATRTQKDGTFRLKYLRDEKYLLFALKDANANYIFDQPNEEIAFSDSLVRAYHKGLKPDTIPSLQPTDTIPTTTDSLSAGPLPKSIKTTSVNYQLLSFKEADTVQALLSREVAGMGQILLSFKLRPDSLVTEMVPPYDTLFRMLKEINATGDSIRLWFPAFRHDTVKLKIGARGLRTDTLSFVLKKEVKARKGTPKEKTPHLEIRPPQGQVNAFRSLTLVFGHPVSQVNMDSLLLMTPKDTLKVGFSFSDTLLRRLAFIHFKPQFGENYQLIIPPGAFTDIFGLTNDSLPARFSTRPTDAYGKFILQVKCPDATTDFLIWLMDDKEKLLRQDVVRGEASLDYGLLLPGKYVLKAVMDVNRNGQWDPGNYRKQLKPEKVWYFGSSIEIKANWDLKEEWIIAK
ncbi:MAG: Ig-like domain-containing protein [Bacteroidales bacterium]